MTPILRAEGAGGTLDSPMVLHCTINTDLVGIANGNDHDKLCFAVIHHQLMLDHLYAHFLNTSLYFLQSHFLIAGVGDIEI